MRSPRQALTICVWLACHLPQPVVASTVLFQSDAQLLARSARVVHARVLNLRTERGTNSAGRIYTVTTLEVLEDFTGQVPERLEVWELGGALGDQILYVGGQVQYRVGQEVLVCLERGPQGWRSMAMGFSKFDVVRTSSDDGTLRRNVQDTAIVGGAAPPRERTLAEFRQLAAQVLRRASQRAAAPLPSPAVSVSQPYTHLGERGWRWRDADADTPVIFYKNALRPPPLPGDAVPEMQKALAAWTNPLSGSIILQYGGTTVEPSVSGNFTSIPPRSGLVSFEDPNDDVPAPVLAIGGGTVSYQTGGTINGKTYDGFESAFVIVQNAADMPPAFKESLDFSRILTHEMGHAIGFDHTQTDGSVPNPVANIMYASCCYPESPVPPALGPDDLAGLRAVYPSTQSGGPTMTLDKTSLRFGAVSSANAFSSSTAPQAVRLTQSGAGSVSWTASSTRPWLQVSPSSGTGAATLTVSVVSGAGSPVSGVADGAISLSFANSATDGASITVTLQIVQPVEALEPIGVIDTPIDNTTGVTGAIPVTGWALDDIQVETVSICRAAVAGEPAQPDARCGGLAHVFLGPGVFIEGARPDVHASYRQYPLSSRAGWGFMVLTNMLPGQGNGTYQFWVYARDREGRTKVLGARTITCDNAHATKPFGTIDTPLQGDTAAGTDYVNFGWALTPLPKTIPADGSTITVIVDGAPVGKVDYNHYRVDIASAFPGLNNTNGAVGFRILDTTQLSNGLHTLAWAVTDNHGVTEGLGSRYFTVSNGTTSSVVSPNRTATVHASSALVSAADHTTGSTIVGRRGWGSDVPWRGLNVDAAGRAVIRGEEVDRLELWLTEGGGSYSGYLRTSDGLAPLPIGSQLDATAGRFTWAPGVGFIGTYDLVFIRSQNGQAVARNDVRVILAPKGSGHRGAQLVIDAPYADAGVDQPFHLGGWAVDLDAVNGTGIDTLHVWAYPATGGDPVFVGVATYGGARPDVATVHGDRFRNAGFGINVRELKPGTYTLAVYPWSNVSGGFVPPKVVRVTVR
jgi:hypothetical protein